MIYPLSTGTTALSVCQGIDQKEPPQTHLFDIAVVDGSIQLTEDGQSISRY